MNTIASHVKERKKKGFEKLCINCQQFRCLSLSWCRFSTRFCQLEEFFCGRSSQYKIVGTYIYTHNSFKGSKPCAFFLHIKRCIFFLKKFFFFNDFHEISSYTGSCFINTCTWTEIRSTIVKQCECVTKDIIPWCLFLLHVGGLSLLDKCIHVDQTCLHGQNPVKYSWYEWWKACS